MLRQYSEIRLIFMQYLFINSVSA